MRASLFILFCISLLNLSCSSKTFCSEETTIVEPALSYNNDDKINLLCELENKVMNQYSGNLLPEFSEKASALFQNCYDQVSKTGDFVEDVNGLILRCIAQFKNGHLNASISHSPYVFLPFNIIENSEGVFVRSNDTIKGCSNESLLEVGDKILSFDGTPIDDLISDLQLYTSASSGGAQRLSALHSFGQRNFSLPSRGEVSVVVERKGQKLNLSTFYFFSDDSVDSKTKYRFLNKNYKSCFIRENFDLEEQGYYFKKPIYEPDWQVHSAEGATELNYIASFSRVDVTPDQTSCYLNLNSFMHIEGHVNGSSQKTNFMEKLEDELLECKKNGEPLIIDFRYNGGGYHAHMNSFMNLLIPPDEYTLDAFRSVRLTSESVLYPCNGEVSYDHEVPLVLDSKSAVFCKGYFSNSKWDDGYESDIIVLTSPACMSNCDVATFVLSRMPNVTTLGTPTHGAFNSIYLNQHKVEEDDDDKLSESGLSFHADNTLLFVMSGTAVGIEGEICINDYEFCYIPLEGLPVEPHITYEVSQIDLVSVPFGSGIRAKISEVLINNSEKEDVPLRDF